MKLFEKTRVPILKEALDAYALRHKVIASNIANAGTVGYKPASVAFEEEFSAALKGKRVAASATHPRHITRGGGQSGKGIAEVREAAQNDDPLASGVNPVDLENEMVELAKNQIRFRFASKLLGETFRGLQKSIRGQA